jgi:hypothetical protein
MNHSRAMSPVGQQQGNQLHPMMATNPLFNHSSGSLVGGTPSPMLSTIQHASTPNTTFLSLQQQRHQQHQQHQQQQLLQHFHKQQQQQLTGGGHHLGLYNPAHSASGMFMAFGGPGQGSVVGGAGIGLNASQHALMVSQSFHGVGAGQGAMAAAIAGAQPLFGRQLETGRLKYQVEIGSMVSSS